MGVLDVPLTSLLARLGLVYLIYLISRTIYDIYLGPLSTIPGPKLAAATRLVMSYHKTSGHGEAWLFQLHQKYGNVVRPAPGEVSFASGKEWPIIYGHASGSRLANMPKDPKLYLADGGGIQISNASEAAHVRIRKYFSYAFSEQATVKQEPLVSQYLSQLVRNLQTIAVQSPKKPTDMVKHYNFMTFDVMADLMFGEPLGCLKNSEYTSWVAAVFSFATALTWATELNSYASKIASSTFLPRLIDALLPKSVREQRDDHYRHSTDRVDQRLARTDARPDIIGLVSSDLKGDEKLSRTELYPNAQMFMFAGTETSATLLSGLTYLLLTNKEKYAKLAHEVRSALAATTAQNDHIKYASVKGLPYLHACVEEALRLYPPVPMGLPRVVGKGGARLGGYLIPENTTVYIPMYSTYRNPANFTHPASFIPERWLKDPPVEFAHDNRSCFYPFSYGPRNCIGLNLAYMELKLGMANMMYHFDMELCEESRRWMEQQKTYLMWQKGELLVTLKPASRE